jgi:hypothetical protein
VFVVVDPALPRSVLCLLGIHSKAKGRHRPHAVTP